MWGPLAAANLYRFSSKEYDTVTGLYYYGGRYYDPTLHRWLNCDPIGETGGINLYTFNRNNPVDYVDPFGLTTYVWPPEDTPPGTYGPTATVVDDGSTAVLPAIPWLTDSQGLQEDPLGDALLGGLANLLTDLAAPSICVRIGRHGPHHSFPPLGKLPHVQANRWKPGVKGSGGALRIPVPPGTPGFPKK